MAPFGNGCKMIPLQGTPVSVPTGCVWPQQAEWKLWTAVSLCISRRVTVCLPGLWTERRKFTRWLYASDSAPPHSQESCLFFTGSSWSIPTEMEVSCENSVCSGCKQLWVQSLLLQRGGGCTRLSQSFGVEIKLHGKYIPCGHYLINVHGFGLPSIDMSASFHFPDVKGGGTPCASPEGRSQPHSSQWGFWIIPLPLLPLLRAPRILTSPYHLFIPFSTNLYLQEALHSWKRAQSTKFL